MAQHPNFSIHIPQTVYPSFFFLPSAIIIFTFVYFFLTNLAIVRARAYGYGSIYDMVTSVICSHVTTDAHYRINFPVAVYGHLFISF